MYYAKRAPRSWFDSASHISIETRQNAAFAVFVSLYVAACASVDRPTTTAPSKRSTADARSKTEKACTSINTVPPEALAPRLLSDQAEMEAYLKAFPRDKYQRVIVNGLGAFYLDDAPDTVKAHLARGVPWERFSIPLLEEHATPGSTVIDAGAHIGTHTLVLARTVGPTGRASTLR